MQSHTNNEVKASNETNYAQLAASVINQYDASLIFYQVKPIQLNKDNIQKYKPDVEEVVRITLPHKALRELNELLTNQLKEIQVKGGEDQTIANLNKKTK